MEGSCRVYQGEEEGGIRRPNNNNNSKSYPGKRAALEMNPQVAGAREGLDSPDPRIAVALDVRHFAALNGEW